MSLDVKIEIKQPHGELKTGVKNGKGWAIAEQEAAVFVPGADYPVVGMIQAKTRDITLDTEGRVLCKVDWHQPGQYKAFVTVQTDRFRRIECRIDDRKLLLIEAAKSVSKAA